MKYALLNLLSSLSFTDQDSVTKEIIPPKSQAAEPGLKLRSE